MNETIKTALASLMSIQVGQGCGIIKVILKIRERGMKNELDDCDNYNIYSNQDHKAATV